MTATPLDASGDPLASTALATATVGDRRAQTTLLRAPGDAARSRAARARSSSGSRRRAPAATTTTATSTTSASRCTLAPLAGHGSARQRHRPREPSSTLTGAAEVPLGATIDARRGVVELTTQTGTARFSGGLFVVRRPTELRLVRAQTRCGVEGAFRIVGRYSTTTASGRWQVRETRAGTVTRVTQGRARRPRHDPPPHGHRPRRRPLRRPPANLKGQAPLGFDDDLADRAAPRPRRGRRRCPRAGSGAAAASSARPPPTALRHAVDRGVQRRASGSCRAARSAARGSASSAAGSGPRRSATSAA